MPKIEVSETMAEFLQCLADRRHINQRGVIAEAVFEYYQEEWIEWKKMKDAETDHE